jgi:hypothetical protein
MMDVRLAIGCLSALCAIWILYRTHRHDEPEVLPAPDKACDRGTVEAVP